MKGFVNGIVTRKKDDGKTSTMLYLSGIPFSTYEGTADICDGTKTVSVYVGFPVECKSGDLINVEYEPGYEGRAVVSGIEVLKRKA